MQKHQFRITIEHISDEKGEALSTTPLQFIAPSHENIFAIFEKIQQHETLDPEEAQRFGLGLKLLGGVMMDNKDYPLFAALKPHFIEMMKIIKQRKPN